MIKLGIVGFGRMGITHYSIINSHDSVQIVGVADNSSIMLDLLAKYVKNVNIYKDYNELIKNEDLDALIICTPPQLHYEIALEAAKNKIHSFVEKPCTIDYSKAKKLSDIFSKQGLVNQVGYVNRFNDIFITVKSYLEKNLIGDILSFKTEMYSRTITKSEGGKNWRDNRSVGGGATFDMAAHAIDLMNYFFHAPKKVVGSNLIKIYSKNVEDSVSTTFLYENGLCGTLNVNWSDDSYRKPTNKIEVFGNQGKILADQHSIKLFLKSIPTEHNFQKGWNKVYITDVFNPVPFYVRGNEFTAQLYSFIECIKSNSKSSCTFEDASETLYIINEIFEDYKKNKLK